MKTLIRKAGIVSFVLLVENWYGKLVLQMKYAHIVVGQEFFSQDCHNNTNTTGCLWAMGRWLDPSER